MEYLGNFLAGNKGIEGSEPEQSLHDLTRRVITREGVNTRERAPAGNQVSLGEFEAGVEVNELKKR